ncbi:Ig-like protein [Leptospira gomenensis]|uniref:Ig-like protein n=1 Tax=Leptospira gomenensis TaxID=2484974 RepID=A0A5F1YZZ7_9LEPT|nr:Ig-like domain-containing protein [Leptospira gomenensis]TGK34933.1 Ig-like protein [Leptospira gomenensis]TGK36729.1 Ig-like protein [Leptospira gomenensis]TGK48866.1 Ig-like protein [Leptospira gomenensis]TGK64632.1 Ig-like protein [Leptospira gomenensis]
MKKVVQYFIIFLCSYCNADLGDLGDKLKYLGLANGGEFEPPTVLLITPGTNEQNVSVNGEVSILFSQPMDKNSVETGITLGAVAGDSSVRYIWTSDILLKIVPKTSFTSGKRYEIRLNRNVVKDLRGNFMSENFLSVFYTTGFGPQPFVADSNPPVANQIVYGFAVDSNPYIQFSEPMDRIKTADAVSVTGGPAIFVKQWNADSTRLTLALTKNLDPSTTYTLKILRSATNSVGNALDRDYSILFYTGVASLNPYIQDIQWINSTAPIPAWPVLLPVPATNPLMTGVSKTSSLQFTFSKPMDQTKTQNAIQFTPSIPGQFTWGSTTILRFTPTDKMTQGATYRLNINSSATDTGNMPLENSFIIDFKIDNVQDSMPVGVTGIVNNSVTALCADAADGNANAPAVPLDPTRVYKISIVSTSCALKDYTFRFNFSTAGNVPLQTSGDNDIYDQVAVSYFSGGPSTGSPNIFYKNYNCGATCNTAGYFEVGIKNVQTGTQYKLRLKGGASGIRDTNDNYMPNDLIFLFERL